MSDWASPLLPQNQTKLEAAMTTACEPRVSPDVISTLWDADHCPVALLPWLAWALAVDDWDDAWTEAAQRNAIRQSIAIHRKKGTVWAVKSALSLTGYQTEIKEWWQQTPTGEPHTFGVDIEVDERGMNEAILGAVARRIDSVKPVRSHYGLRILGVARASVYCAAATLCGEVTEIKPRNMLI